MPQSRLLFVCDSDSNFAFSSAFSTFARAHGAECDVAFCPAEFPILLQAAARRDPSDTTTKVMTDWRRLFEGPGILDYDTIFVMLTGKEVPKFVELLRKAAATYGRTRPRTIGGFIGEWISGDQQVIERTALDLFVINRPEEKGLFQNLSSKSGLGCRFEYIPYPFVLRHDWARPLAETFEYSPDSRILFAEQVQVPRAREERKLLFRYLTDLARIHPKGEVLFCEREVEQGATLHRGVGKFTEFLGEGRLPKNFKRLQGGFRENLPRADVVVSVSSTACIEALVNGVPAIFIGGFLSSGVEKFAHTGLVLELPDLFAPQHVALTPAFHKIVSDREAWTRLLALAVDSEKRRITGPARVLGSVMPAFSPSSVMRDALFEAVGACLKPVQTPLSPTPLSLKQVAEAAASLPGSECARMQLSDAVRFSSPHKPRNPVALVPDADGSYAPDASGSAFSIHFGRRMSEIVSARVECVSQGETFVITADRGVLSATGETARDCFADLSDVDWSSGKEAILRLRSFEPLTLKRIDVVFKGPVEQRPERIYLEPSYFPSDIRVYAPIAEAQSVTFEAETDVCVMAVLSQTRRISESATLLTLTSPEGVSISIKADGGDKILVSTGEDVKSLPWREKNALLIFATGDVGVVMLNENVIFTDKAFRAAALTVPKQAAEADIQFDALDVFVSEFPTTAIDRCIELVVLRSYDGDKFAGKHTEMRDDRNELNKLFGEKKSGPMKANGAKPAANGANGAHANGAKPPVKPKPDSPLMLSQHALEQGDYASVIAISVDALAKTPSSTRHMWMLVEAHEKLQRPKDAAEYCLMILAAQPGDAAARERYSRLAGK